MRWEYLEPKPISLVIHGDEMVTWYRDLGRAERVKVGRVSSQVFKYLNASGSLESLLGYFAVTFPTPAAGEPYQLELVPRYRAHRASGSRAMTLWIDRELFLPVRVRYVEAERRRDRLPVREAARQRADPRRSASCSSCPQDVPVREVDLDAGTQQRRGSPRP